MYNHTKKSFCQVQLVYREIDSLTVLNDIEEWAWDSLNPDVWFISNIV